MIGSTISHYKIPEELGRGGPTALQSGSFVGLGMFLPALPPRGRQAP